MTSRVIDYALTHPDAIACLPLLSPFRVWGGTVQIWGDEDLAPAIDAALGQRSIGSRDLGLVILAVCDPPFDTQVLAAIRPLVLHLLTEHHPAAAALFRKAIDDVFTLLGPPRPLTRKEAQGPASLEYRDTKGHPLATMHLLGAATRWVAGREIREASLTPVYRKYALPCHLAFRRVERYYLAHAAEFTAPVVEDHLYQCALSLRRFLQCLSFVDPGTDPRTLRREILRSMAGLREHWLARGEAPRVVSRRVHAHARNVRQALEGRWARRQGPPSQGDPGGSSPRSEPSEDVIELPSRIWPDDGDPHEPEGWSPYGTRCVSIYACVPSIAVAVGECEDDYAQDVIEVRGSLWHDPRAAAMAALRAGQRLHRDALWFPFSAEYVQLHDYGRLYRWLFERPIEDLPTAQQATVCVLLLVIHAGIDPDVLCGARLWRSHENGADAHDAVEEDGGLSDLGLSWDAGCLALHRAAPLGRLGYRTLAVMPSDPLSRTVHQRVCLPLPPFLHGVLECYLGSRAALLAEAGSEHDDHLFFKGTAPPTALTVDDLADYVRARGEAHPRRVLSRLARSFFPLYVSRLSLDPVLASYVNGKVPRIFATQMFYTHVASDRLTRAYWTKARNAHRLMWIAAGLGRSGQRRCAESRPRAIPPSVRGGYGSRIVPRREALGGLSAIVRAALSGLASRLDEPCRIHYHNLYAAWAYLIFLLVSGARPIRDERLSAALESPHPSRLRILDKQSPQYVEVRTIRRHPFLRALGHELERARRDATALPSFDHLGYEELGCPLLFFLEQDGRPVGAKPGTVRDVLERDAAGAFPYPLNAGRHLLETVLGEAGADRPTQDYSLGHQRRWREALNRFSAGDVTFMEWHFAEHVQQVIQRYGLEVLPYRPVG